MKKTILQLAFIVLAVNVVFISGADAAILPCDGSQSDCQAKVTSAANGDTVSIPAGSFNWGSSYITMNPSKNINIIGAGIGNTTITGSYFMFFITMNTKTSWRVSGMSLINNGASGNPFKIDSEALTHSSTYGWRVDHIAFSGTNPDRKIFVFGTTWGLIDHCTFSAPSGIVIQIVAQMPNADETYAGHQIQGSYDLSLPMDLGTNKAVYVEDCTFTFTDHTTPGVFDMDQGGGRIVFRHNTVNDGFLYNHWNRSSALGGIKWEVYNNKFIGGTFGGQDGASVMRFQAGTGVIFNNTITGYSVGLAVDELRGCGQESGASLLACGGSHAWDGNIEATGWPCLNQIGRASGKTIAQIVAGDKQTSSPAYAWNNGTQDKCYNSSASGSACTDSIKFFRYNSCSTNVLKATAHNNGNYDYVNNGSTSMPGYKPYTYPHPLTMPKPNPNPPRNLRIGN